MKDIDYTNKTDRKIDGMFYVENHIYRNRKISKVIFSPDHQLVKPAFDYIREKYFDEEFSENKLEIAAKSICHYLNFCRLHKINIEEPLTNQCLKTFIQYLYFIPKRMLQRIKEHPSKIKVLAVHPYISNNEEIIRKIYKEWYTELLFDSNQKFTVFYDPKNIKFDEDKMLWTHNFNFIKDTVSSVLEYLHWLGKSPSWSHRYQAIDGKVARRAIKFNEHSRKYYIDWDIDGRIKKVTKLSKKSISTRRKRRVFYETELRRFFNSNMIQKYSQRKLFFLLLLLSGCRESECLNMLIKNVRVTLDYLNPYGSKTIAHWEDMFDEPKNDQDVDILINKYLEFNIRIAKRRLYESKRRRNKSKTPRITPLRDYFDLPDLLNLNIDTIFVNQTDFIKLLEKEIILEKKEKNPYDLVKEIMLYHYEQSRKGISVDDPRYSSKYRYMIQKIRKLLDNSWLGNLIRTYLIERQLLLNTINPRREIDKDYLFINQKINKGSAIEPDTVNTTWFKSICEKVEPKIMRALYEPNKVLKHAMKKDLTTHSFRHTYISSRICIETEKGKYNDALLKKEVGHVPTSTVAETVYFFSDSEKIKEARIKLFRYMKDNIGNLIFKEQIENDEVN
ncbi:hypothetical protein [Peribacillus sp. Hz7]|uniref:hypothetical protein n=1 Tax=Peribacillus sp. Hz7 TaxID=3344873 RepID=UPI0035CB8F49